jgi:hypothetical protein
VLSWGRIKDKAFLSCLTVVNSKYVCSWVQFD